MKRTCALFLSAVFLASSAPLPAQAAKRAFAGKASRAISFKANPTRATVGAGKITRLNMLPWIQGQGSKPVFWQPNLFNTPVWVTIDEENNQMIVNPPVSAVGIVRFDLLASTGGEETANGRIELTVRLEPIWESDRINVGNAPEDAQFSFPLASKVNVPGGGAITFTWEAGGTRPPWISLSPSGVLSGTPRRADVGNFGGFFVIASTASGGTARAEIFGTVSKVLKPPKFLQTGFTLPNAFEDAAYSLDISTPTYVSNFENVPLTFTKLEGPAWLGMTNKGVLSGTPNAQQVGPVTLRAKLEGTLEGTLYTSEATFTFNVQPTNDAPVWTLNPVQLPDAKALKPYSADLRPFVTDEENDVLTFTIVSGPQWAKLSPQGVLSGSPPNNVLGTNSWLVRVSDGQLTADATVRLNVTNTPPRWKSNPVMLPNAKENNLYQQPLASFVEDENGDALTFTLVSGPPWASVSPTGTISGTPRPAHLGVNKFNVRVADGVSGQAVAEVQVFVENVNDPPEWTQNPLVLGPTDERVPFSASLSNFVTDPDVGDMMTFSKINGPDWATVSSDGLFAGTPGRANVGLNVFRLEVTDRAGAAAQVDVFLTVNRVNQAPQWTVAVIDLPDALEDSPFSFNIATFATDEDGDALTFLKAAGPAWLVTATSGTLSGKPALADVGDYIASFVVSDGKLTRTVPARGRVNRKPRPPQLNADQLVFTVKERAELAVNLNDPRFVVAQNGLPLTFELLDPSAWVQVRPEGPLTARPLFAQVGRHEFRIRVSDALMNTEGKVTLIVERDPRPPVWTDEAIVFETPARTPFSSPLSDKVTDLDGIPLTFTKKSGPTWLSVTPSGQLTGTPPDTALGDNAFVITARNDLLGADKDVLVKVTFKNHEPEINVGALDFTVKERAKLVVELSDPRYVSDSDNDPLQFALLDSAQWVVLDADGTLTLQPKFPNIGVHNFKFRVTDGNYTVEGTIKVTVVRDPRAPVWMQDPITFDAKARQAFTASLNGKAVDLDGLPVTYAKKSGPAWLTVGADGALSGTPGDGNVGDNSFVVTASNDLVGADVTVVIRVLFNPKPPKLNLSALVFTVKERATLSVDLNDPKYVTHTDPTPLSWQLLAPSEFVTLTPQGQLEIKPLFKHIGQHALAVKVTNAGLSDEGPLKITVLRDPRPPVWTENPIRYETKARVPFTADLKQKVQDLDGLPLTFAKKSGAPWLTVAADGKLSGTPTDAQVGEHTIVVTAANDAVGADVTVIVKVLFNNHPPTFTQNPIQLPDAFVAEAYRQSIRAFANDVDPADVLTFEKVTGAGWVTLGSDGSVTGTPAVGDIGLATVRVRVSDGAGGSAEADVRIQVRPENRPPVWSQNPIDLGTAIEDSPYRFDLKPFVRDADGNPITLTMPSAPAWLKLGQDGVLTGTPAKADVGNFSVTVVASDGKLQAQVVGNGRVVRKNVPPEFKVQNILLTVKERQRLQVNLNDPQWIVDENGDPLTFSVTPVLPWVTVASNGALDARPLHPQVGPHDFKLTVSDGKLSATGNLRIQVLADPQPPKWERDPLVFETLAREPFRVDLKPFATDVDGVALVFTKKSGPVWLTVGADGVIGGTPTDVNVGENAFIVTAKNETLSADVNVIVKVLFNNHPPVWSQDPIDLPDAFVGQPYASDVAPFASDPDTTDTLTFSRQAGPNWLVVAGTGKVSGTPLLANVGVNTFQVRVTDPGNKFAVVTVRIKVIKPNTPPKWSEDPIRLADGRAETPYMYDVSPFVQDEDGDTLTFRKVSGPNWLQVAADGKLTGTPSRFDVGDYVSVLEVTDNKNPGVRVNAVGRVLPKANPPVIHQDALFFVVKERATLDVDLDQKKYVEDVDNLPLSFELIDVAPWVSLSQRGRLLAQPFFPQIGDHEFKFRVTNNQFLAEGILHIKVIRDPRPPVWSQNPIRFRAKAREPFSATLADKVSDPDGLPLTFAKKFGAEWLSMDARGNLFGTPQPDVIGENTFLVTAKNDAVGSDVTVIVFVENNNNAPFWAESPIRLPDARIDVDYLQTVEPFAKDPDPGDKLKFRKLAGPDWVFVGQGGTVLGKPGKLDEGVASVRIRITDPWNLWADVTVIIHVTAPAAPRWLKDPIPLGDVRVGNLYGYDISPFAVSDEGLPLTFSKVTGPGWLQVFPNGKLAGRPAASDVGPFTAVFAVSDGRYVAQANGYGRVLPAQNSGPVFQQNPISFTMKEREVLEENLNQRKYVYDPDGDPITMELLAPAAWITLTTAGQLSLKPLHPQVGEHTFTIRVKDDKGNSTEGKLYVRVLPDAQAPLWLEDPIRFTTYVNKPFLASIAEKAKDPDGKQLAFGKVTGPEWLVVAPNGGLSGLPVLANLGENTFRVFAKNDAKQAEATLVVTVLRDDPITDSLGVDDAVPGASAENMWVVDNSWCGTGYSPIVNGLRASVRTYFNLLEQAKVQHVGAYLSSDAKTYDGRPLRDPSGEMLFFWKDAGLIENFAYRLVAPHSGYCYSSPIWATYRFQRRVPTEWPFYKKDFVRDRVPQDVLIATIHPDYFSYYTRGRPEQNWTADDFAGSFLAFAAKEKQSLRVSVIAPQCTGMGRSEEEAIEEGARSRRETVPVPVAAPSAYARLVDRTKGEFLALNCQVDYDAVMRKYAKAVIFRAYVHAKQRISLSKKPLDVTDIEVRLGGRILDKALWRYDASSNAIEIDWVKVDVSVLKPGDRIEIKYRA